MNTNRAGKKKPAETSGARRQAIINAGLDVFSRYGFHKTKTEDIARAADIPRTTLYRSFANKEEIFRALVSQVHAEALSHAQAAMAAPGGFPQRLTDALIRRDIHLLKIGHSGPHAAELSEYYMSLAADLTQQANTALENLLTKATAQAVAGGEYHLPAAFKTPKDFVRLLRLSLEGIKTEVKATRSFDRLARQLLNAIL